MAVAPHNRDVSGRAATAPNGAASPPAQRSAVTNGKRLHVVAPGDTKWSRRFRDVLSEIISDLGGDEGLSRDNANSLGVAPPSPAPAKEWMAKRRQVTKSTSINTA